MNQELPEGAQRVQQFLTDRGSHCEVRLLPESTATAQDAADALGVPVRQIGKSIVLGTSSETIVAVVCGDQRVDVLSIAQLLSLPAVKPLKAVEVKQKTGFVIGGVSPFALPPAVTLLVDPSLQSFSECYVAAGHPKAVVKVSPDELISLTKARVAPVVLPR